MSRILLLADDSLAIQRVVGLTFEQSDFELVVTSNGDEALTELARCEPAVVLADVHMPGASGYDVARSVKDGSPDTPVLLLVGTFEAFDEERARASGADGHLLKPFDSQELLQRVETLAPAPRQTEEPARAGEPPSEPIPAESAQPASEDEAPEPEAPEPEAPEPEASAPEAPALPEPAAADGPSDGRSNEQLQYDTIMAVPHRRCRRPGAGVRRQAARRSHRADRVAGGILRYRSHSEMGPTWKGPT